MRVVSDSDVGCEVRVELAAEGATATAVAVDLSPRTGAEQERATADAAEDLHTAHVYCTAKHEQAAWDDDEEEDAASEGAAEAVSSLLLRGCCVLLREPTVAGFASGESGFVSASCHCGAHAEDEGEEGTGARGRSAARVDGESARGS